MPDNLFNSDTIIKGSLTFLLTLVTTWAGWSTSQVFNLQKQLQVQQISIQIQESKLELSNEEVKGKLNLIDYKLSILLEQKGIKIPPSLKVEGQN